MISRRAVSVALGLAAGMILALFVALVGACDEKFLQEPTEREPDLLVIDVIAGFVMSTYEFIDGRTLTVFRQLLDTTPGDEFTAVQHPLFYLVKDKKHVGLMYVDKSGHGNCFDIERY